MESKTDSKMDKKTTVESQKMSMPNISTTKGENSTERKVNDLFTN